MEITTFAISEAGARDYNEDSHADVELMGGRCVIVADGAGGHRGGGVASRTVVDAALLHLASIRTWDGAALAGAIDAASAAIKKRQTQENLLKEMSSTVALLGIDVNTCKVRYAHLGDSRILFFRGSKYRQLTRDHSVRQSLVDAGLVGAESPGRVVDRTTLYAAVGAEGETRPVVGDSIRVRPGDAFLLCTDGAWDSIRPDEMNEFLGQADTVRTWVTSIGKAINRTCKANQDNYTAVGVWMGGVRSPN